MRWEDQQTTDRECRVSADNAGHAHGDLDHYFSNGTLVEDLAGTVLTGAAHGYRVVMRASGTLRSPVVFTYGRETVEPVDSSAERLTISINGSAPKVVPQTAHMSLGDTCSGNALTESDGMGDVFTPTVASRRRRSSVSGYGIASGGGRFTGS
jgi:hypothetical protein